MIYLAETDLIYQKNNLALGKGYLSQLVSLVVCSRVTDGTQERDGWVECVYLDLKTF